MYTVLTGANGRHQQKTLQLLRTPQSDTPSLTLILLGSGTRSAKLEMSGKFTDRAAPSVHEKAIPAVAVLYHNEFHEPSG